MSRLDALFAPRGIAVIGASRDPGKLGAVMARSLSRFPGPVVGVNARDADPRAGRFATVADAAAVAPDRIDLAVLCVPAAVSAPALADAARAGIRAALVCSGGYAEAGGPGARYQEELVAAATAAGVALIEPNTSGFLVPSRGLTASFVPGAAAVPAGPVAVVAASGGVNHALAFLLAEIDLGVSLAIGLGNAVDVTAADVLSHLTEDEATRAVALHVESVPDGPALLAAVRALTARVPVAALVVDRNDVADFARSHTGALATSWRTTRAALRAAGAVLVDDERQLVDAVTALSARRLPPAAGPGVGPGVGIVTAQAGPGLLHVDGLRGRGVAVPPLTTATQAALGDLLPPLTYQANPVDTGRPGPGFSQVLATVAADPGVDLVSVYALAEPDALDLPTAVEAAAADGAGPFVVALVGPPEQVTPQRQALRKLGVPALGGPAALTVAVAALLDGVTVAAAVPAVAQRWLAHATEKGADDVATLRLLQVGGARLADEVARTVRPVLGATLQQVFGMAEGLLNYTRLDDPEDVICTTQGRPMSEGDEVRVVDELDRDLPDGTPGALLTRGPYTPRGYYRATEQNARAFTADGWYRSGDIVRRRPDGNLVVEGRDKDMINRGGEKISAEEVENLAYQLPQIIQVAAIAMPDPDLGERVCLYAVLEPGTTLTLEDVRRAMAAAGVATFKWPERLEIIAELPATKVGKIDKKALKEDIARRLAAA